MCIVSTTPPFTADPGVPYEVRINGVTVAGSGAPGSETCFSKELGRCVCPHLLLVLFVVNTCTC